MSRGQEPTTRPNRENDLVRKGLEGTPARSQARGRILLGFISPTATRPVAFMLPIATGPTAFLPLMTSFDIPSPLNRPLVLSAVSMSHYVQNGNQKNPHAERKTGFEPVTLSLLSYWLVAKTLG